MKLLQHDSFKLNKDIRIEYTLTMTMDILSGKACAAKASAAVIRAEVESASTDLTARHIIT